MQARQGAATSGAVPAGRPVEIVEKTGEIVDEFGEVIGNVKELATKVNAATKVVATSLTTGGVSQSYADRTSAGGKRRPTMIASASERADEMMNMVGGKSTILAQAAPITQMYVPQKGRKTGLAADEGVRDIGGHDAFFEMAFGRLPAKSKLGPSAIEQTPVIGNYAAVGRKTMLAPPDAGPAGLMGPKRSVLEGGVGKLERFVDGFAGQVFDVGRAFSEEVGSGWKNGKKLIASGAVAFGDDVRKAGNAWASTIHNTASAALAAASVGTSLASAASPDAMNLLTGSFKLLAAALGITLLPIIIGVASGVQQLAAWFYNLDDSTKDTITQVIGIGAALLFGAVVMSKFIAIVMGMNPIIALLIALGAAVAYFVNDIKKARKQLEDETTATADRYKNNDLTEEEFTNSKTAKGWEKHHMDEQSPESQKRALDEQEAKVKKVDDQVQAEIQKKLGKGAMGLGLEEVRAKFGGRDDMKDLFARGLEVQKEYAAIRILRGVNHNTEGFENKDMEEKYGKKVDTGRRAWVYAAAANRNKNGAAADDGPLAGAPVRPDDFAGALKDVAGTILGGVGLKMPELPEQLKAGAVFNEERFSAHLSEVEKAKGRKLTKKEVAEEKEKYISDLKLEGERRKGKGGFGKELLLAGGMNWNTPQYGGIEDAYKKMQLSALGDDPVTQQLKAMQAEAAAKMERLIGINMDIRDKPGALR
jgi:hypothetical protein